MKNNELSVRGKTFELVLISLMGAVVVISARLSLSVGPVPITMQTMAVLLTGLVLGTRIGWLVPALYLLMGLLGFPVFAGGGGIGYLFKPSFGFILGFIPAAYLSGFVYRQKWFRRDYLNVITAALIGDTVIYLFGLGYIPLAAVFFGSELAVLAAILPGLPFMLLGEVFKIMGLALVVPLLVQELEKARQSVNG
ncbi:MAG: biotin transporter BioY [Firmicutes bacterium]|nr:biotin transporter BioY [Bacillota bacterium]